MLQRFVILAVVLVAPAAAGAQPTLTPGDNLVVDGIPPIPAALAEEVGRYTEFRTAVLLSWHPTRREVLISTRFADTAQVHQVKFPGGARTQLTFFRDSVRGASYPPKASDYFVFGKDAGGNEFMQLYRFDVATGKITLLTDGKSRNGHGVWSSAGDRLAYPSTRRTGKDTDLYVIDPADPKSDRLVTKVEGGGWTPLDWSPDDRRILLGEYVSINESYLWAVNVATGERTAVVGRDGTKAAYPEARFAKDGKGIYVVTDRQGEFKQLALLDAATGRHTYLTSHIPWDVKSFELSPDGRTIAFITNEAGVEVLRLLDTASGKEQPGPKLPPGNLGGVEWQHSGRELGFTLASARAPADVYSFEPATGKVERWTHSETGGINAEQFVEPELIRWKSFDGLEITGFLYRPPARFTGKRPVVINIHGGPEAQYQPGFLGRNNYLLDELGVALLFPNIRGSAGYGKTYLTSDNGVLRENAYKDIGTLFDWIRTRPDLDADRVMVTGGSYGGHMTLVVATLYADRIRCALDVVGMSHLATFLQNTEAYRRDLRRAEYGDERDPKTRAFMDRFAPLNNADKITKPLFIVQGKNDPRVPWTESEQMANVLKQRGVPVWYLMARDEGHGFAKKRNADFQFYATVLFMKEYLLK
jgi:dipeptidyl aminopeptidase/acylaminoacyl peptidase